MVNKLRGVTHKQLVRKFVACTVFAAVASQASFAFGADFPTAKVNTSGLAVTDMESP